MRANVHVDKVIRMGKNKVFLEAYVLKGNLKKGMVCEESGVNKLNVGHVGKNVLQEFERGKITLNGKVVDFERLNGLNLEFKSPFFFVDWKDGVVEKCKKWREEKKEGLVKLRS